MSKCIHFFIDQTMHEVITSKTTGVHINQFYKSNSQIIEWRDWLANAFIGCQFLVYMFFFQHFPSFRLLVPISHDISSIPKISGKVLALLKSHMI